MNSTRRVARVTRSSPTVEGAGVRLKRAFVYQAAPELDPFLLLDEFHSNDPADYIQGFPWHPHRGIETITYMLQGEVEHADSLGNRGLISSGDVQWMTAGSGIVHHEMPKGGSDGAMWGFQLWANLPAAQKMMEPRYRDIARHQIPEVVLDSGVRVKVISGELNGISGPVHDVVIQPEYLDVSVPASTTFNHRVGSGDSVFAYVVEGEGRFDAHTTRVVGPENLIIFGDGENLEIVAGANGVRFLLVSGKPLKEPVAWLGPIVMNTQEELRVAFEEYRNGTFLKHKKP